MMNPTLHFSAPLWLWQGKGAWHFLTLPKEMAEEIRFFHPLAKGFMPIPVEANIGGSTWKTSLFPDSKRGTYLLAVKVEVRKRETLSAGTETSVSLRVLGLG
jgi:hypothetical protein